MKLTRSSHPEHIKYPDANKPPANTSPNPNTVNPSRKPGTPSQHLSPSQPPVQTQSQQAPANGTRAMSPTDPAGPDGEELRRAMSPPVTRPGTRTPNGSTSQGAPGAAGVNGRGKAPTRPRRDDDDVAGTDDGHGTDSGTASDPSVSAARAPSPTEPRARSPTSLGVAGRATSPVGEVYQQQSQTQQAAPSMTSLAVSINGGLSVRSPSPIVDRSKQSYDPSPQSVPAGSPLPNGYAHSHTPAYASGTKPGSTGNVTADLIRDYKAKEMEVELLRKREAWMKTALLKAHRNGFVQVDEESIEAEELGLGDEANDQQQRLADMILNFKHFKTQMQVRSFDITLARELNILY